MKKAYQITEDGRAALEQELDELKGRRGDIAEKIAAARDFGCHRVTHALEDTINHVISQLTAVSITLSPDPLHKVLITEALVEGHKVDTSLLDQLIKARLKRLAGLWAFILVVLGPALRVQNGQRLVNGVIGLTCAGRAIEDLIQGN